MGRKLTLYLDGQGKSLPVPRQFEKDMAPPAQERPRPDANVAIT
jgi:hypothetical protein